MQSEIDRKENDFDLNEARRVAIKAALKAGYILRKHFGGSFTQTGEEIMQGFDLSTQADTESDELIRKELIRQFPQSEILSEEVPPENYGQFVDAENLWIVDPLDGTINFSRGHKNFAISIALVSRSVPKLAVIYLPMGGEIYWAQANEEKAYLNDMPIRVSRVSEFNKALVAIDWPYTNLNYRDEVLRWARCFAPYVLQPRSTGSAVSDLASLAAGKIDAYVQLGTKPWDTAAGSLLVQKAGGMVTTPDGGEWNPFNHMILATNGILHEPIASLIRE